MISVDRSHVSIKFFVCKQTLITGNASLRCPRTSGVDSINGSKLYYLQRFVFWRKLNLGTKLSINWGQIIKFIGYIHMTISNSLHDMGVTLDKIRNETGVTFDTIRNATAHLDLLESCRDVEFPVMYKFGSSPCLFLYGGDPRGSCCSVKVTELRLCSLLDVRVDGLRRR